MLYWCCFQLCETLAVALSLRICSCIPLAADGCGGSLQCCRGLLTPDTKVYFTSAADQASGQGQQQQPGELEQPHLQHQQEDVAAVSQTQQQPSQVTVKGASSNSSLAEQQQDAVAGAAAPPVQSRVASAAVGVQLLNAVSREAAPPATNLVHVYTSDGEWFPVKKKLLRPCIALTKVLRP